MDLTSLMEREKNGSAHSHWVFMKDGSLLNHKRAVTCQKNGVLSLLLRQYLRWKETHLLALITNIQAMDF